MLQNNPKMLQNSSERNVNTKHLTWVLWKPEKALRGSCDETLVPRAPSACCRGQQCAVVPALCPILDASQQLHYSGFKTSLVRTLWCQLQLDADKNYTHTYLWIEVEILAHTWRRSLIICYSVFCSGQHFNRISILMNIPVIPPVIGLLMNNITCQ